MKIFSFFLALLAIISLSAPPAQAVGLGLAGDFNTFIFDWVNRSEGETGSRVAVGGDANFYNFWIDKNYPPNPAGDLILGRNATLTNTSVANNQLGYIIYGGLYPIINNSNNPVVSKGTPIDFAAQRAYYTQYSQFWGSLPANGATTITPGWAVTLTGTDSSLNIFQVPAKIPSNVDFNIQVPSGSTVLINLPGSYGLMSYLGYGGNIDPHLVLYNFYEATILDVSHIGRGGVVGSGLEGSILAPYAQINFQDANIKGNLIGSSLLSLNAEEYDSPFQGNLPASVPEPLSFILLASGLILLCSLKKILKTTFPASSP